MKLELNSLPWQSLSVAVVGSAAVFAPSQASAETFPGVPAGVTCMAPDVRTGQPIAIAPRAVDQEFAAVAAPTAPPVASAPALAQPVISKAAVLELTDSQVVRRGQQREAVVEAEASWEPTYRGTGVTRMRDGAAKDRILRMGVLWTVDPSAAGLDAPEVAAALRKAGASSARVDADGKVFYRATKEHAPVVAQRALKSLGGGTRSMASAKGSKAPRQEARVAASDGSDAVRQANLAMLAQLRGDVRSADADALPDRVETAAVIGAVAAISPAVAVSMPAAVVSSDAMGVDVAMMRVESSSALTPEGFIDALPAGMSVYPFGSSFAVHVPASMVESMWGAIDGEGKRVLLVGASAPLQQGAHANEAIKYCGGNTILGRFPTPQVDRVTRTDALLSVEGQKVAAGDGDVMMVVQGEKSGSGLEVALMRFVKR